ncbi:glycoside hydrolase superfamily [Fennellomyces sp. T-0311]|nr:glycoside hydrolase superfamily [Fennellomyces sp. T-0311]
MAQKRPQNGVYSERSIGEHYAFHCCSVIYGYTGQAKAGCPVNGERVFRFSGEFHYYRLPSPDLWNDVLQKFKALGFNGVSYYFNWRYHSPKRAYTTLPVYVMFSRRWILRLETIFMSLPVLGRILILKWIAVVSPAGGWTCTVRHASSILKTTKTAKNGFTEIDKYLVPSQVLHGGPIILNRIDNEHPINTDQYYMQMVKDKSEEDGMTIPSIHNVAGPRSGFVRGVGAPGIYGWDRYPVGFGCSGSEKRSTQRDAISWRAFQERTNRGQPMAASEFQGSAFDPWGGMVNENVCQGLLQEQLSARNHHSELVHGVWRCLMGWSCKSRAVYTSYDYDAPISEPGPTTPKGYEIKLQSTFLRTVKPFWTTEHFDAETTNENILIDGLYDINLPTKFYIARHLIVGPQELDEFTITMDTTAGTLTVSRSSKLILNGRVAKIITSDYAFHSHHLIYTTNEIFTHQAMGSHDVILVYAYEKGDGEFAIKVMNTKETFMSRPTAYPLRLTLATAFFNSRINIQTTRLISKISNRLKRDGKDINMKATGHGTWIGKLEFSTPKVQYTDFAKTEWKYSSAYDSAAPWLNGEYLGGFDVGNHAFTDLNGTLIDPEGENVISLLLWTTGHEDGCDADGNFKQSRGFTQAELLGISNKTIWSIDWKVQGNLGGEDLVDPVRGPCNEGGLYGVRMRWHLTGFPDDNWETVSILESKNRTRASWYHTTFDVNVPEGYDAPMCLRFDDDTKTRYRALIFDHGWQYGRYANDLGRQTQCYLPKGILTATGEDTLVIAVIPIDQGAQLGKVVLDPYKILESSILPVALVDSPTYRDRQKPPLSNLTSV